MLSSRDLGTQVKSDIITCTVKCVLCDNSREEHHAQASNRADQARFNRRVRRGGMRTIQRWNRVGSASSPDGRDLLVRLFCRNGDEGCLLSGHRRFRSDEVGNGESSLARCDSSQAARCELAETPQSALRSRLGGVAGRDSEEFVDDKSAKFWEVDVIAEVSHRWCPHTPIPASANESHFTRPPFRTFGPSLCAITRTEPTSLNCVECSPVSVG